MIDYYTLLSQRRLLSLTKTEKGMQDQLKYADESFKSKREAMDRLPGGRITKLIKLQKKAFVNKDAAIKRDRVLRPSLKKNLKKERRKTDRTPSSSFLNTNLLQLKDNLRVSQHQSIYALTAQTVESKRMRLLEVDKHRDNNAIIDDSAVSKGRLLSRGTSSTSMYSVEKESTNLKKEFLLSPVARDRTQSLGDYFTQARSRRGSFELGSSQHKSHRKLSLELDDPSAVEAIAVMDHSSSHRPLPSLFESLGQSDRFINQDSYISCNGDQDLARKKNDIARLMRLGFLFHELGNYFHENHLPNHFRRLLFANSIERKKSELLYSRKNFVGTSSSIRHFKNWQAAQAVLWDPELDVVIEKDGLFSVRLLDDNTVDATGDMNTAEIPLMDTSKHYISQKLEVPKQCARVTIERSKYRVETMQLSRTVFDRSCKRILGCVLNPGGW